MPCSTCRGRFPRHCPRTAGSPRPGSRPWSYVAGASAAAVVGKPWLARGWRRAVDLAGIVLIVTMAVAGNVERARSCLLALAVGGAVGAALLVGFGAPNRRPSPAIVASTLRDAGLAGDRPEPRARGRGPIAALSDVERRRVTLLREGLRPGQSRRRSALPRLPHDRVPRLERRAAGDDAGVRRRARSAAADARPARRGGVPAGAGGHRPARRFDDAGHGRRRRTAPGRAGARRAHPRTARRRLAARSPPCTGPASPTGRCAPPTSSSPRPVRSSSTSGTDRRRRRAGSWRSIAPSSWRRSPAS